MKKRQMRITDLNIDVLKKIVFHVASSSNGAVDVARVACVCKAFRESVQEVGILLRTNFSGLKLPIASESIWKSNGLLKRCACVGNPGVFCLLLRNLRERTRSVMVLDDFSRAFELLHEQVVGRYRTRSRFRAVEPLLKFARGIIENIEINSQEFQEIVKMLEEVKLELRSKQEGNPEHYRAIIDLVQELEDLIKSELLKGSQVFMSAAQSMFSFCSLYTHLRTL